MSTVASQPIAPTPPPSPSFARGSLAPPSGPPDSTFSELMDATAPSDPPPPQPLAAPPGPPTPPPQAAAPANTAPNTPPSNAPSNPPSSTSANNAPGATDTSKGAASQTATDAQGQTTTTSDATQAATQTAENSINPGTAITPGGKAKDGKDKSDPSGDDATALLNPTPSTTAASTNAAATAALTTPVIAPVVPPPTQPTPTPGATGGDAAATAAVDAASATAGNAIAPSLAGLVGGPQKPGQAGAGNPTPPSNNTQPDTDADFETALQTATPGGTGNGKAAVAGAATDAQQAAAATSSDKGTTDKTGDDNSDSVAGPQLDKLAMASTNTQPQAPVTAPTGDQSNTAALTSLGAAAANGAGNAAAANAAAAAAPPPTAMTAAAASAAVPLAGVAVAIAARAQAGSSRFDIRLDPPDLGRIDVQLNVDKQGNVTSHLVVERSQTLDMLRSDAPKLQQAGQDAGLKTSSNGLQFSLSDQGASARNQSFQNNGGTTPNSQVVVPVDDVTPVETARNYGRLVGASGGLDIRV